MQKIPTLFVRDELVVGHPVIPVVTPGCEWVLQGEGIATIKIDGTNVKIEDGRLYKRRKPKARDYDEASYVLCDQDDPADRWAFEGIEAGHDGDGIYELVGPKVQGNPHHKPSHVLIRVVPPHPLLQSVDAEVRSMTYGRSFAGLKQWLTERAVEGLVFHHADGRMAKIKRRDFGLEWPWQTP